MKKVGADQKEIDVIPDNIATFMYSGASIVGVVKNAPLVVPTAVKAVMKGMEDSDEAVGLVSGGVDLKNDFINKPSDNNVQNTEPKMTRESHN